MSLDPVIQFVNVSKSFGKQQALDDVSFSVPPGVVFGLLGENGAGKTTAIRILLGLTQQDAGTAKALGLASLRDGIAIRRRVGYVSERPVLYEWMTVEELGWFVAGYYPPGFLENYRQHARRFDLPADRRLKELSKGMRSKVVLSLALAHAPQLLILDEPTSGLDAVVRREFLDSMVDLTADGRTVFLSSHQIHEVERVADMIAIIHRGKVLICEPLDQLKQNTTEVAAALVTEQSPLELPVQAFALERKGRHCRLFVRGSDEVASRMLREIPVIRSFELRRPSLEEIFVAYMRTGGPSSSAVPAQECVQ
jgi:ABC-2 type transport system ATP-binding protein